VGKGWHPGGDHAGTAQRQEGRLCGVAGGGLTWVWLGLDCLFGAGAGAWAGATTGGSGWCLATGRGSWKELSFFSLLCCRFGAGANLTWRSR